MLQIITKTIFAGLSFMAFTQLVAQEPPEKESKIGRVIILGNNVTQDRVIRRLIQLYPGTELKKSDLERAEERLANCKLFRIEPAEEVRPRISILEDDGEYKDILVEVEEMQTFSCKPTIIVSPKVGVGIAYVAEECNFDWWHFSINWNDYAEGRAFRGGGQKLQVGLVYGLFTQLQWHISISE